MKQHYITETKYYYIEDHMHPQDRKILSIKINEILSYQLQDNLLLYVIYFKIGMCSPGRVQTNEIKLLINKNEIRGNNTVEW